MSIASLLVGLADLFNSKKKSRKAKPVTQCALGVESLEDRRLLAVSAAQFYLNGTKLVITGSNDADTVTVTQAANGNINARLESGGESIALDYLASQVTQISFSGKDGDDTFVNSTNLPSRALGEGGNDTLVGGSNVDDFDGGEGDDLLIGGDGNDILRGSNGNDVIQGDGGNDQITGGAGNDLLRGGAGADVIRGGAGDDQIWGEGGNDRLFGDEGSDLLYGGEGDDHLEGGVGDDVLSGGLGNDTLLGHAGNDILAGDEGDDTLSGHDGNDTMRGGAGNDLMRGGAGNDIMYGQHGDDKMFGDEGDDSMSGDDGNDEISGGEGDDKILGGAGNDVLKGDNGNDTIFGEAGDDTLLGGDGNDQLKGGDGQDIMRGGAGNDFLNGQLGDDKLYGDAGDDSLHGDQGNDQIYGGDGDDRITGGLGDDILSGERGKDSLWGDDGNDILYGGDDADRLFGGAGNDTLRGGNDKDLLRGDAGADQLYGENDADTLYGGAGDDFLYGGEGNDRLEGEDGDDQLFGDAGHDYLDGQAGNDRLVGGSGDDRLYGGIGDDQLMGGDGADYLWGQEGNDSLYGQAGNNFLFGGDGDDTLVGEAGHDLLSGDAGADTITGGAGNDILIGGEGADSLNGSQGEDLLIGGIVTYDLRALELLMAAWSSAKDYHERIHHIEDESFAAYLQSEETVFDDYVADTIVGGDQLDWFILTGSLSIYDPNMMGHAHQQAHSAGGHHGLHVIGHLPILEGFDLLDSLDNVRDISGAESVQTLIPHADDMSKRREHLSLFELVRYDEVTHYAVSSGNWSDPSTWHDGIVPANGSRVLIPIGVEVAVDKVLMPEIATIRVDGTLSFATQVNTQLRVDTLIVSDAGSYVMGTSSNPIAADVTARLVITDNGVIDRTWDPFGISRGLITHGEVSIHGAAKTSSLAYNGSLATGSSSVMFSNTPVGWAIGDRIAIPSTTLEGEDEVRTIRLILGNRVFFDPLSQDHTIFSLDQTIHVANLTRNVVIESEGTEITRLGHVMFMHNPNVEIANAKFYKLGRTDKTQVINDPDVDANWNLVPGTGTNPRARYAVHFHRTGTSADGTPATVSGSVVEDNGGWGYVNHSSNVDFINNVSFNVLGSAFVTEVGDEIGSFVGNLAIQTKSSGEGVEARLRAQDFGHGGDAFWFQGTGIRVVNNVAAHSEGHGFIYFSKGLVFGGHVPMFEADNLADPSIANGADSILTDDVPILQFSGNIGYASKVGVSIWYNQRNASHNAVSVIEHSSFWNNTTGAEVPYARNIILSNLIVKKDFASLGNIGVNSNAVSKNIIYDNLYVSGYHIGIEAAKRGYSIINGGAFETRIGVTVRPAAETGRTVIVSGNFTMMPLASGVLGNYTQLDVSVRFEDDAFKVGWGIDHLFYDSKVFLNYGLFGNRQLYSPMQVRTAVPFPVAEPQIPAEYVGKTTGQLRNQYGLTLYGELAPDGVLTIPTLGGLLGLL